MFVWQHVLSAIILAIVLNKIIFKNINIKVLLVVLILAQAIDLDHYNGDPIMMLNCAVMTSCHNSIYQVCQKHLDRGILHTHEILIVIGGLSLILYFLKHNYLSSLVFIFGLGVLLHFFLDFGITKLCLV